MRNLFGAAAAFAALALSYDLNAQTICKGSSLGGAVLDSTDAVIAGAPVIAPEASTWMLMLAGLGAVALRIRLSRPASQPGVSRS